MYLCKHNYAHGDVCSGGICQFSIMNKPTRELVFYYEERYTHIAPNKNCRAYRRWFFSEKIQRTIQ